MALRLAVSRRGACALLLALAVLLQGDKMKFWVLTKEINQYYQEGAYLVAVYSKKPTAEQLMKINGINEDEVEHVLKGGGRERYEEEWFNLEQLEEGFEY